jgi:hypothetical protein
MEPTSAPGNTLDDEPSVLIDEDRHGRKMTKFECRSPKQAQNSKPECPKQAPVRPRAALIFYSSFEFVSRFGIRISGLRLSLVNEQFVPIRIAELCHPTDRRLGFIDVEGNAALLQLFVCAVEIRNLERDRSPVS